MKNSVTVVLLCIIINSGETIFAAQKNLNSANSVSPAGKYLNKALVIAIDTTNIDLVKQLVDHKIVDVNYKEKIDNPANNILAYAAVKAMSHALVLPGIHSNYDSSSEKKRSAAIETFGRSLEIIRLLREAGAQQTRNYKVILSAIEQTVYPHRAFHNIFQKFEKPFPLTK